MRKRVVKSDRSGEIRWGREGWMLMYQARAFVTSMGLVSILRLTNLCNESAIIVEGPNMSILL